MINVKIYFQHITKLLSNVIRPLWIYVCYSLLNITREMVPQKP